MGERARGPVIYLDHAATSFPKPPEVVDEIRRFLETSAGNPGRSGHRLSAESARVVFETREILARRFGVSDSRRVIFTGGATEGLNLTLFGSLGSGDHVVTTSVEHNAVMRPLRHLSKTVGVTMTVVQASPEGLVDPDDFVAAVQPGTRLAVINHASNVCGAVQPLEEIARRLVGRTLLVVDAAQTAGLLPLDLEELPAGAIAVSGHKSLLGPPGIAVLLLGEDFEPLPLQYGGTGSGSESDEMPAFLPDRYEAGTPNTVGVAGLLGALRFRDRAPDEQTLAQERALASRILDGLGEVPGVTLYGPRDIEHRLGIISLNLDGVEPAEVGRRLDENYGILVRCGLHCSPHAHRTLGTFPRGSVRVSVGFSNTSEDVDRFLRAIAEVAHG
jgi:cysteine desulfurase/selenocysteine lyase